MAARMVLLCLLSLVLSSTVTVAQNPNEFLRFLGGFVHQGMIAAAMSEWRRLPADEVGCIDQAPRQQGASIEALASRGIYPSDPRLTQLRSGCGGQITQLPPSSAQPSPYVVDGLFLGGHVNFGSNVYKQYNCGPSDKFLGFTWCHREKTERTNLGEVTLSNSILHAQDGTAWYINRYIEPAFFAPNDIKNEIQRLSARFGEKPREFWLPHHEGLPDAVIAVWGKVELQQLDPAEISTVGSGGTVKGLLVSYLGDLERSAKAGVPVYRLGGNAGFVWAATYDQHGRGVLRFLAADISRADASSEIARQQPSGQPSWQTRPPTTPEPNNLPSATARNADSPPASPQSMPSVSTPSTAFRQPTLTPNEPTVEERSLPQGSSPSAIGIIVFSLLIFGCVWFFAARTGAVDQRAATPNSGKRRQPFIDRFADSATSTVDETSVSQRSTWWWIFLMPGKVILWVEYMFPRRIGGVFGSARRRNVPLMHILYSLYFYFAVCAIGLYLFIASHAG